MKNSRSPIGAGQSMFAWRRLVFAGFAVAVSAYANVGTSSDRVDVPLEFKSFALLTGTIASRKTESNVSSNPSVEFPKPASEAVPYAKREPTRSCVSKRWLSVAKFLPMSMRAAPPSTSQTQMVAESNVSARKRGVHPSHHYGRCRSAISQAHPRQCGARFPQASFRRQDPQTR